jgi:hypothetical protein
MHVQMVDRLPAVGPAVDDEPVPRLQAEPPGQLRGHHDEVSEQSRVIDRDPGQRLERSLRDHEHVHWRLWRDVVEGEAEIVVVFDPRGNLAANDLGEDGISHRSSRGPPNRPSSASAAVACGAGPTPS